jgi:hypothetical protein
MDDEENIPIRILENFKILDATSHASVPFASLLRGGTEQDVFAVGRVSSARPGDLESQDNDPLPIKTTPLLKVDEADDNAKVDLYFFDEAEKTCDSYVDFSLALLSHDYSRILVTYGFERGSHGIFSSSHINLTLRSSTSFQNTTTFLTGFFLLSSMQLLKNKVSLH